MSSKRAYILIEILLASIIFITASFSLAKSFIQSAHTYKILNKLNDKNTLRKKVITKVEETIKEYQIGGQDLNELKEGSISEKVSYSCNVVLSETLEGLYIFEMIISNGEDTIDQFKILRFIQDG